MEKTGEKYYLYLVYINTYGASISEPKRGKNGE